MIFFFKCRPTYTVITSRMC